MSMFCYQCEQAAHGTGCDRVGVCGKQPDVAALQDLLVHQVKGIGWLAHTLRERGTGDAEADRFVVEALFSTVTNVNFDTQRMIGLIGRGEIVRQHLTATIVDSDPEAPEKLPAAAKFIPADTDEELIAGGEDVGIRQQHSNDDIRSLQQLLIYGLKGMAAYADHAALLGETDDTIYAFFHEALAYLNREDPSMDDLFELNMRCGQTNIRTMELLDKAHTEHFGHPEPAEVSTAWRAGPAIVVSGHDLLDLEKLLQQTQGTGVNVYTHGEMLPAHGYPGLRTYPHLVGHFGTAWQNQQREFDGVPAVFLFTTNCIQKPRSSYIDNVFTTGLVAWPGVSHVDDTKDFTALIQRAKELGGLPRRNGNTLRTGFGRNAVLQHAEAIVDAVKKGAIKRFFVVGGCDGTKPGRNYYTEFVEKLPADTVVLTLACGKFRFNHLDLGRIGGIPRLLDLGQCNDAYSAIAIAGALAKAFDCGLNDLPLSLVLSWYEQKAVVILLSLLSLGIRNIRIGPSLPAFVSPNVLDTLVKKFGLTPVGTAEEDIKALAA